MTLVPIAAVGRGDRGASTRASPTPPSGRSTTTSSPSRSSTASGGTPTSRSTGASPSRPPSVAAEDATVWVHDYQLQLVPQMLRELRPDLRIGFFLHIPFPPAELFQQLPWRRQILEGLLGADLVGFQLPGGAAELRPAGPPAGRPQDPPRPGLPARRPHRAAPARSRSRSTPRASRSWPAPRRSQQRADGDPRGSSATRARCFLGIDRLDYTKGIYARLRAFGELIARRRARRRGRRVRAGRDAVARAGRAVPHPPRRDRPPGRPDQRRPRPDRPPGDPLPARVLPRARRWPRSTGPPTSWW